MRLLLAIILAVPAVIAAQDRGAGQDTVSVRPSDVESPRAIVEALYQTISGPQGAPRDWPRFRTLMMPGARMMMSFPRRDGSHVRRDWNVEEYILAAGPGLVGNGFFEREIGAREERFGAVAHRWSAYDSRSTADGPVFQRGINSIQLWTDGSRWWIVSVIWDNERDGLTIPEGLASAR